MVSKNPVFLVIKGHPTDEQLQEAWENIRFEYGYLMVTRKSKTILDLYNKIQYTHWKIDFIKECIWLLRNCGHDNNIAEYIQSLGYDLIEENEDNEAYLLSIHLIDIEARFLHVHLNQLYTEYKLVCPDNNLPIAVRTIQDYDRDLAIISKYMGFRIDKNNITTSEYCSYANVFNEGNEL